MNNKAKILLLVAGATGLLFMTARKSSAAETEEEEDEETVVPVGPPVQIPRGRTPDDFFGDAPMTVDDLLPKAPGEPPKFFPTPPTQGGEPIPPKKAIPEDDEAEESENPAPPPVFTTQPVPTVPRPPPVRAVPPPPKAPAEKPTNIPADTAELLRLMLARETTGDWKRQEPALALWQRERDLTADKKFGPQSALTMAEETGLLPIVRFWPKGAQKAQAVEDYQEDLLELASKAEEPRRSQLKAAAEREQGQGFGRNPIPITPTILI